MRALAALAVFAVSTAHAQVTDATRAANAAMAQSLRWEDREDEEFATRGFIAGPEAPQIRAADGRVVWDFALYDFVEGPAPETVNPSLWRNVGLLRHAGLFRVHERVYQVRGFDLANMTIVLGESGLIVIDPLTSAETAAAVRAAIHELPDAYRTVLLLRDIEGLDTAESAQALGISENAVKTRLHRARQALRTLLEQRLPEIRS